MTSPEPGPRANPQANPWADEQANPRADEPANPPASTRANSQAAPPRSPAPRPDRPASRVPTLTLGSAAWLVVLAAVAFVQVTRRAWVDTTVLVTALVALGADASRRPALRAARAIGAGRVAGPTHLEEPTRAAEPDQVEDPTRAAGPAHGSGTWRVVLGAAALAGLLLVAAPRHGAVAGLVVSAAGAGAVAYAWPDRPRHEPAAWDRPTRRTAWAWSAAWIAGCLWELAMFVLGNAEKDGGNRYPAASDLLDPLLNNSLVKGLFVVLWLSIGVGLLARTDRR